MTECALTAFLRNFTLEKFEINHTDDRGKSLLHIAAAKSHIGVLKALLKGGANPNLLDNNGLTPLCLAI